MKLLPPTIAIALFTACAAAEVDMPFDGDSDGDGLLNSEEDELGTDPSKADSDDDGWEDLLELDGNTDPLASNDHPYTGGWTIDACRHDIEGEAVEVGSIAPQFELLDQHGDTVRLHDFCNQAVLIVFGAGW